MRLITNLGYSTVAAYFRGIEDPTAWSLGSPAVFGEVSSPGEDGVSQVVTLAGLGGSDDCRYLAFKVLGGVEYVLHSDVALTIVVYDYLNGLLTEIESGAGGLLRGVTGGHWEGVGEEVDSSMTIRECNPRVLLARISGFLSNPMGDAHLSFSECPAIFDWHEHWERDWVNRIDGTSWSVSGKVPVSSRLSDLGRNAGDLT